MVGLSQCYNRCVLRCNLSSRSFCAFYLQDNRVFAVDAVDRPGNFMQVRRGLDQSFSIRAEGLEDESIFLKELLAEPAAITGKS